MISEGSCDTEGWSSCYRQLQIVTELNGGGKKYINIYIFKITILVFYCIFIPNAALVNVT